MFGIKYGNSKASFSVYVHGENDLDEPTPLLNEPNGKEKGQDHRKGKYAVHSRKKWLMSIGRTPVTVYDHVKSFGLMFMIPSSFTEKNILRYIHVYDLLFKRQWSIYEANPY